MDAESQFKISGKKWYPRFKHRATERDFTREFNLQALNSGRIGVIVILIIWCGFAFFDLQLELPARSNALFFRLIVATPVFAIILSLLYSRFAAKWYQLLICLCLFLIEGSLCYVVNFYNFEVLAKSIGYDLPMQPADAKCSFIFVWLLIIFMASVTVRMNMISNFVSSLIFICFNVLSLYIYQPSWLIVIIVIPFFIASLPIVWIESLHVQNYARQNYRASQLLSKYLSPQLTETISQWKINRVWKHSRKKITMFFSDIKDFTSITDSMEPEDMAELLNDYFTRMNHVVNKYQGTLIQFIGDGLFVIFGAPHVIEDVTQAKRCVNMAIEMQSAMTDLNSKWFDRGIDEDLKIRCGINTGMATVGGYGSSDRKEYTAIGMQVNIAARLEQLCEPGGILISHSCWSFIKNYVACQPKGLIDIKGFHKPVRAYSVTINSPESTLRQRE